MEVEGFGFRADAKRVSLVINRFPGGPTLYE